VALKHRRSQERAIRSTLKFGRVAAHQVERGPLSFAKVGAVAGTILTMGSRCTEEIGGSASEDEWQRGVRLWSARVFQQSVLFALDESKLLPQLAPHWFGNVE
jgi:hypothetical protein